jgi:hypothetical protein
LQNQGAGIAAGGDTLAFFNKYDRCQRPIAVTFQKRMYLDKSGKVVHKENMKQNLTSWDLRILINFVWYYNFAEDSPEFEELMMDMDGVRHRITLPPGKMQSSVWNQQIEIARTRMSPQFAEIIAKTKYPFVQAITDVISPKNSFMGGKVLLIGDALAGFRPHYGINVAGSLRRTASCDPCLW